MVYLTTHSVAQTRYVYSVCVGLVYPTAIERSDVAGAVLCVAFTGRQLPLTLARVCVGDGRRHFPCGKLRCVLMALFLEIPNGAVYFWSG
jgi:hypothetical protein